MVERRKPERDSLERRLGVRSLNREQLILR